MRPGFVIVGKSYVFAGPPLSRRRLDRLKAGKPIRNVVLKARLGLLPVTDDINSDRELLMNDLCHRFRGLVCEQIGVIGLLVEACQQQV